MITGQRFLFIAFVMIVFTNAVPAQEKDEAQRKKVEQILEKHFAVDSKVLPDRTFDGFLFGAGPDKQPAGKGPTLRFDNDKLVAVTKNYSHGGEFKSSTDYDQYLKKTLERVYPMLGEPNANAVWDFKGPTILHSLQTRLIRYSYPQLIVYVSPGPRIAHVTVYDRDYLLDVLRRDLLQKAQILESCKPVAEVIRAGVINWAKVPMPTIENGFVMTGPRYSVLTVKKSIGKAKAPPVYFAEKIQNMRSEGVSLRIHFLSFPAYQRPPLIDRKTSPGTLIRENQYLNAALVKEFLGFSNDGAVKIETIALGDALDSGNLAHRISWDTADVRVSIDNEYPLASVILSRAIPKK